MSSSSRLQHASLALRAGLDRTAALAAWLVLPLALLLFVQWPLRDLVGAFSRQANDIAQWLFALYLAFALREATRRGAHLAAGLPSAGAPPRWRRLLDATARRCWSCPGRSSSSSSVPHRRGDRSLRSKPFPTASIRSTSSSA
jgi:hypothetical protein